MLLQKYQSNLKSRVSFNKNLVNIYYYKVNGKEKFDLLTKDEELRAAKFRFSKDQQIFRASRSITKIVLAQILDTSINNINICYNKYGKPFLEDSSLKFNVSHSDGVILAACCVDNNIGVDIEYKKKYSDLDNMAQIYFSKKELQEYLLLPDNLRADFFYYCWTLKESFIKLVGEGLSYPLDKFTVNFFPQLDNQLVSVDGSKVKARAYTCRNIMVDTNYAAAYCIDKEFTNYNLQSLNSVLYKIIEYSNE